ncbi:MAG TPA: 2-phosphosulfolactate phosphatase [Gaiellaceae bacterium]|nr:2-phosphosulfolactate phosphatase [Gaiellaceae bacterium]
MRVHVAFTPAEEVSAPVGIVIDVLRATSTICQALAGGYERVLCTGEVDDARTLSAAQDGAPLAGERLCVKIEGFDFGNSPREFANGAPNGSTLVLTTTNGTRLLLAAAARCETVLVGSLLNLRAVVEEARAGGAEDVAVLCAGVKGELALDDAYCAGRIAEALGGEPADSAAAAIRLARTFGSHEEGLGASTSAANLRNAGLHDDIVWCAQESVLDIVPRVVSREGLSVEVASG